MHPSVADQLCDILPPYADCQLAPVAAWADKVRMYMRWSGPLHYVNGVGDHPSQHCVFGEEGWQGGAGRRPPEYEPNTRHHKGLITYEGAHKPAFELLRERFRATPLYP